MEREKKMKVTYLTQSKEGKQIYAILYSECMLKKFEFSKQFVIMGTGKIVTIKNSDIINIES